jgi:hypothetical protein
MIISKRHGFVMLLPWKTASSTAYIRLEPFNESPYERFYDFNPHLLRVVHQHLTYRDYKALPVSMSGYRTAAFVRNPYDRVYSGFVQLQRDIQTQPNQPFAKPWVKELVMSQLSENFAQLATADFDFDKWVASIKEYQIYEIGRNSSFPLHPAHYWTGLNEEKAVDFVGKVENFEADFEYFCRTVDIPTQERVNDNVTDAVSEATDRPRYLSRMNPASISKINRLFRADFDLFEYERYQAP